MSSTVSLLIKKRNGQVLTKSEITQLIRGIGDGSIPDYQASAFLMAGFIQGFTDEETEFLTEAMMHSGKLMDLSTVPGFKCDKHSTGGVGDKITMIIAPLAASLGLKVPMYSGKGLGHTGGTIDKLDSINGFRTVLTEQEFLQSLKDIGIANSMQSETIAPADKKLYALRDVTGTVDSIPLITGSIMSKKLACGADGLVLDVKCGKGAFMKSYEDAKALAQSLMKMAKIRQLKISALIDSMNEPLGHMIGNSLEMIEVIDVLKGKKIDDLLEVSVAIVKEMMELAGNGNESELNINEALCSGKALDKFREWVEYSGGNPAIVDDYSLFPQAEHDTLVKSEKSGYLSGVDSLDLGLASMKLGAGRMRKEDKLDYAAGIDVLAKTGDFVEQGQPLAKLIYNTPKVALSEVEDQVRGAFEYSEHKTDGEKRIIEIIK